MPDVAWDPVLYALLSEGRLSLEEGSEQLAKALYRRLITYPGELPAHPDYGSRIRDYVGQVAQGTTLQLVEVEAERALMMDPRVRSVRAEAYLSPEGALVVEARVEAQEPYGDVTVRVEVPGG